MIPTPGLYRSPQLLWLFMDSIKGSCRIWAYTLTPFPPLGSHQTHPITGTFLPHVFHVSHAQALTAGPGHLAHPQNSGPTPRLFPPLAPGKSPAIGRKNRPPVGCSIEYILPEIREYSTEEAGVGLKSLGPSQLAESSEKTTTLNKCLKMISSSEIKV